MNQNANVFPPFSLGVDYSLALQLRRGIHQVPVCRHSCLSWQSCFSRCHIIAFELDVRSMLFLLRSRLTFFSTSFSTRVTEWCLSCSYDSAVGPGVSQLDFLFSFFFLHSHFILTCHLHPVRGAWLVHPGALHRPPLIEPIFTLHQSSRSSFPIAHTFTLHLCVSHCTH